MYTFLHNLLSDKKGGAVFNCFGIWHLLYILTALAAIAVVLVAFRKRGREGLGKAAEVVVNIAFGLYVLDFFLMPFAYQEIDIEKLAKAQKKSVEEIKTIIDSLHEFNPMMGHRGCRLAVTYPEIARMQTKAVIRAAINVS